MKYGFIGCGNMGGALASAVAKSGAMVLLSDPNADRAMELADRIGAKISSNVEIALTADFIVLGVKPQVLRDVLTVIKATLKDRRDPYTFVSMAAGVTISTIEDFVGNRPIIRIMPNSPVEIGEGLILYTTNDLVSSEAENEFLASFAPAGTISKLDEKLIDAASAVSGCGPAFAYMFISAMADGGVRSGLPRQTAIEYAARTLLGSAAMVLETGRHPEVLKDAVCSPAGSTIEGVATLESAGFRSAVTEAVTDAWQRTVELGK